MARYESWQSIEFQLIKPVGGIEILTKIQAVSYSDALERELVYGAGREPLGTTDPVYVPGDMSLEFLFRWHRAFIADVTGAGASKLGDLDFRLQLVHKVRASEDAPLVDVLEFTMDGGEDSREKRNPAALVTTVPCMLTKVTRNGVTL